jgi:hypothetical protein
MEVLPSMKIAALVLTGALLLAPASAALAYNCPVQIKLADEMIARAEKGKMKAESKALLEEARKLLGEARVHHEQAKGKKDHDEAIRKAKTAQGLADEAQKLQQ